ncbi:MAG TPA: hypothetical protein VFR73_23945, partial [Hyphomicrobiaceae bacterium]|nr:hypothetical protein [Hyphomicrobiaceae bacterium]
MSDYWFKPKSHGYGATPANWKGWAATIGTIITSFTVQTDGDPLANYKQLTSPLFLDIIRNNII